MSPLPNISFSLIMFFLLGLLETVDPLFLCIKKPSHEGRADRLADILFIFPNIVLIVQHAIWKYHKFVALVEVVK